MPRIVAKASCARRDPCRRTSPAKPTRATTPVVERPTHPPISAQFRWLSRYSRAPAQRSKASPDTAGRRTATTTRIASVRRVEISSFTTAMIAQPSLRARPVLDPPAVDRHQSRVRIAPEAVPPRCRSMMPSATAPESRGDRADLVVLTPTRSACWPLLGHALKGRARWLPSRAGSLTSLETPHSLLGKVSGALETDHFRPGSQGPDAYRIARFREHLLPLLDSAEDERDELRSP